MSYELKLRSNGLYYLYENGELLIEYIPFNEWNKGAVEVLIDKINKLTEDASEMIEKKHCFRCGNGMTKERDCGHCKHLQIDGMFGMWCDIYNYDWMNIDAGYCSEFTR